MNANLLVSGENTEFNTELINALKEDNNFIFISLNESNNSTEFDQINLYDFLEKKDDYSVFNIFKNICSYYDGGSDDYLFLIFMYREVNFMEKTFLEKLMLILSSNAFSKSCEEALNEGKIDFQRFEDLLVIYNNLFEKMSSNLYSLILYLNFTNSQKKMLSHNHICIDKEIQKVIFPLLFVLYSDKNIVVIENKIKFEDRILNNLLKKLNVIFITKDVFIHQNYREILDSFKYRIFSKHVDSYSCECIASIFGKIKKRNYSESSSLDTHFKRHTFLENILKRNTVETKSTSYEYDYKLRPEQISGLDNEIVILSDSSTFYFKLWKKQMQEILLLE